MFPRYCPPCKLLAIEVNHLRVRIESRSIASCEKLSARYQFDIFAGSVSSKIASGRTSVEQARIFHYIRRIFAYRRRRSREAKTRRNVSYSSCDRCKVTAPRSNLETGRTVCLTIRRAFVAGRSWPSNLPIMVTAVEYPRHGKTFDCKSIRYLLVRKSSCRRGGLFGTLFACFFLFFALPNRILQIACQIVSITLGLVELALGLQLLVARDLAKRRP
jgi:hypothetical protein